MIDTAGVETPPQIELPNSLFDPSGHKGILKFFNSYNFTASENVQDDEDVAVDPEMLGKVFENMLASEERGQNGTFYTPRGIVQFMCVESLSHYLADQTGMDLEVVKKLTEYDSELPDQDINQLLTKEQAKQLKKALDSVKICDPAVGSGAFPMGMMQVILSVKQAIAWRQGMTVERGSLTISQWKRDIIANNLYGVDIKPEAVEIAKLRMWLSLVVDIPEIDDVEPLPNLDYKLMCGDSLISTIQSEQLIPDPTKDQQTMLNVTPIQSAIQPLIDLQHQYFEAHAEERKILIGKILEAEKNVFRVAIADRRSFGLGKQRELENKIKLMKGKVSKAQEKERQQITDKLAELSKFAAEVENGMRSLNFFQWHLHFNEVFQQRGGFDIVIGNPPYVGQKGNKEIFEEIRQGSLGRFYRRGMDLLYFFFHLALDISKNHGYISYITTNYFLTADGAELMRKDLASRSAIIKLINFNELKIFDSAKGQHNIITIIQKNNEKDQNKFTKAKVIEALPKGNVDSKILADVFTEKKSKCSSYNVVSQDDLYEGEKFYIRLTSKLNLETNSSPNDILNLIKEKSNYLLGSLCNINPGVQSGADKVSQKHIEQGLINLKFKGCGIYTLSQKELENLQLLDTEIDIIKPFFKNSDIDKYFTNQNREKFLIYVTRDINIDNYPNIEKHFNFFKQIIQSRNANRGEMQAALKLGKWWVLRVATKSIDKFSGEKIVCPNRSYTNTFGYNEIEWFAASDVFFITAKPTEKVNLKFILALLNSRLYYCWLFYKGKRKGNALELIYAPLSEIPIYIPESISQQTIIKLVDKIFISKQSNPNADTSQLEAEIDKLIYELYDLTEEEIAIVENAV
ncbi:Eco57I restriction-modification methylase domain-containing protein [Nostoc sp. UIC 10607]|uniref:Eco57I restriction-modification methylase domain-containing protein n=1 Tax=Nostoc sp. UIC 10607 TaxID=3045935 RepID=UPI0039A034E7